MIRTYPQLMEPSFIKGKLAQRGWHRIDIADHPPAKSKRRPIIANSAKAAMGKEKWDQMEQDGIIEKVKPGSNTDWSGALHLTDKPRGRVRPCTDFRLVNQREIVDAHPLPLIWDHMCTTAYHLAWPQGLPFGRRSWSGRSGSERLS